jgi:hypothetical protein
MDGKRRADSAIPGCARTGTGRANVSSTDWQITDATAVPFARDLDSYAVLQPHIAIKV